MLDLTFLFSILSRQTNCAVWNACVHCPDPDVLFSWVFKTFISTAVKQSS